LILWLLLVGLCLFLIILLRIINFMEVFKLWCWLLLILFLRCCGRIGIMILLSEYKVKLVSNKNNNQVLWVCYLNKNYTQNTKIKTRISISKLLTSMYHRKISNNKNSKKRKIKVNNFS
jgi:glucan phosphoethanolaminetransferase (alkaline phosphatase superfamily)